MLTLLMVFSKPGWTRYREGPGFISPLKRQCNFKKTSEGVQIHSTRMYTHRPGNKACKEADVIGLQVPESSTLSGEERGSSQQGFNTVQRAAGHGTLSDTKSSSL